MAIVCSMGHSMQLSEIGLRIMREIALSPESPTAYSLKDTLKKDYKTIHTTCKKLVEEGYLEETGDVNKKNVQKKVLRFSIYGFCYFVTKCGWFFPQPPIPMGYDHMDYNYPSQRKFLKNWQHLHETIAYFNLLSLKFQEMKGEEDKATTDILSHRLYFACSNIVKFSEEDWEAIKERRSKPTMRDMIKIHNPNRQLYIEMFEQLIHSSFLSDIQLTTDDVLTFFRGSKGTEYIKLHLMMENLRIQTELYCIKNF